MWRAPQKLSARLACVCRNQGTVKQRCCRLCTKAPEQAAKTTAPPPPPVQPPSGGGGGGAFVKLLGLTVVGAGGLVGYTWYDPSFREKVEGNVPYSKDAFKYIFEYLPPSPNQNKSKAAVSIGAPIVKESNIEDVVKASKATKTPVAAEKKSSLQEEKAEKSKPPRTSKDIVQQKLREKEAEEAAENAALETILATVCEEVHEVSERAKAAQHAAADSTKEHTKLLRKAMDDQDPKTDKNAQWEAVSRAFEAKAEAVEFAEKYSYQAKEHFEKLKAAIQEGKENAITKRNKAILKTEEQLNKITYTLKNAEAEHDKSQMQAKVMQEYRELIKKGKEQFRRELESIMPDVKIGKRLGGRMTEEELNSLIAHAHRRIEQLQQQLAEQQALEAQRMQDALERQRHLVGREKEHMLADFDIDKQKWETEAAVRFEIDLRQHLARQAAAHSDHLAQVLKVQETELRDKFETEVEQRILAVRDNFRGDLSGWISRMRGIEAAIESRAEMEKQGRKAQELWLACQTLQALIHSGPDSGDTWEYHLKPLADELDAIREAGNNHPFVNMVINSIPAEAVTRGVCTEEALVERFTKVRRVGRRVALVPVEGSTMFRYFLSYLQSMFVFAKNQPLSEQVEVDPEQVDTFTLLDNATQCLEHGDLIQALRYVNQLRGEARCIAEDWIKETRLLLETKQAADALLAHASASGLGALF